MDSGGMNINPMNPMNTSNNNMGNMGVVGMGNVSLGGMGISGSGGGRGFVPPGQQQPQLPATPSLNPGSTGISNANPPTNPMAMTNPNSNPGSQNSGGPAWNGILFLPGDPKSTRKDMRLAVSAMSANSAEW